MNNTPNLNPNFFTGRLTDHEDGDIALQKEETSPCPDEAASIKAKQQVPQEPEAQSSPGGVLIQGLGTPKSSCATLEHGREAESSATGGNTSNADTNIGRRHQSPSEYEEELRRLEIKKKKIWNGINRKQGVKLATLNMRGRKDVNKKSKWPTITTLMRKQKILLLALQETHLDDEEAETIGKMCPKIEIINNGVSKIKEGVAFAINKDLANNMTWNHTVLIEGRASRLTIKVEEERGLDVIVIYAPNGDKDKKEFFIELKNKLEQEQNISNTVIMGDFNSVEHELDRFPHRKDKTSVINEWLKIKKEYKLIDGWRLHNELRKEYTYTQDTTHSMSRIDRIYIDKEIYPYGYNWSHINSAQLSDHEVVTVEILKQKLPYIGKGVWRMQQNDIDDETVREETRKLLKRVEEEMKEMKKDKIVGIQKLWMDTKEYIKKIVESAKKKRKHDIEKSKKKIRRKIDKKLEEIEADLQNLTQENSEQLRNLKERLAKETNEELTKIQESARARYRQKGEKYTKYWFKINKQKVDSQVILSLQNPDGSLTDKTNEMTGIALNHHSNLQKKPEMTEERQNAINTLKKTTNVKTSPKEKDILKKLTSYEEIEMSLKKAPNGSSPGLDGIPYEFYKQKLKDHEKNTENPDIVGILHLVIEEIETYGLDKKEFTDGLMHLVFKKKEKWKIENYRPITLLNTDYKTYTKTIAMRLAEVAKSMIHEDQAGFVPQRSLYDHTKTTSLVIEYCEMMDKNGCIIALDQEKAYDKIDHEYLWQILEHYEFPKEFILRIKELYKNTGKSILVNGVMTQQYRVERGVHQGDPMSCLLYDFAIEPLADAIRESDLKGIKVNEQVKRLIVNLFADDTLVYLDHSDNIKDLKRIIDVFCKASTARFNLEKTEYLPIGNKEFRKIVIEQRKMGNNKIENGVKIVKDGEAMRTLGSWVGNDTNADLQWNGILQKQESALEAWSNTNMSLKGKEIILKALIQSKAMFLATVNGMPADVEEKMKKMFKDFLWEGKTRGLMSWNQIIAPREEGGLAIPDIRTRIEAIEVMWLKKWLSPNKEKPRWTYILDEILNNNITKSPIIDPASRISWIKQSWHESKAKNAKISKGITNMLAVARKYNMTLEPLKYSEDTKNEEPLWHNRLMTKANYQWNKKSARCLRDKHHVKTIKDIINEPPNTCNLKACKKMAERLKKMIPEIIDPTKATPQKIKAKHIDLTPRRLKKNEHNSIKKVFNPDITVRGSVLEQVRLFDTQKGSKTRNKKIEPQKPAYREDGVEKEGKTKAIIVTAIQNEGKRKQKIKVTIKLTGSTRSKISFKLDKEEQSKEKAITAALLWILKKDKVNKLEIITTDMKLIKWIGGGINEQEDKGWVNTKEKEKWKIILNLLRKRNAVTKIRAPKEKEEKRMKLAKNSLRNITPKVIHIAATSDGKFLNKGARLDKMTQKLAYELILSKRIDPPGGPQTEHRLKELLENLRRKWNIKIGTEKIWKDLKYIKNMKIQEFIWKIIHNKIKCGKFFQHIPNWQDKQFCMCGQVESIEHILLKCKESKQKKVWKEVKKLWKKLTGLKWRKLKVEDIMSIGSIKVSGDNKMFFKEVLITLVTTAIWSIWKNRNDRIFNDKAETEEKQIATWKRDLVKEVEIEYELIKQDNIRKRRKNTNKFLAKWSLNTDIIRIEETEKGKRRLITNL